MRPIADDTCGVRCLTVLNSWTTGINRIRQNINLPAGEYRLLLDMKYECPNEQENNGFTIVASGNTNQSYTGIKTSKGTDYRFSKQNNTWEVIAYDFCLEKDENIELSLGFSTSTSTGAANNSLLYIDNLRLLSKNSDIPNTIKNISNSDKKVNVYTLTGIKVRSSVCVESATNGLPKGIYIVNNEKISIQ
jgi:hypothetical protein